MSDDANFELRRQLQEKLSASEEHNVCSYLEIGYLYTMLGQQSDALAWYKRATERYPDNSEAWYFLGAVSTRNGNYRQAQEALEESLKLEGNQAKVYVELMYLCWAIGLRSLAKKYAFRAIKMSSSHGLHRYVYDALSRMDDVIIVTQKSAMDKKESWRLIDDHTSSGQTTAPLSAQPLDGPRLARESREERPDAEHNMEIDGTGSSDQETPNGEDLDRIRAAVEQHPSVPEANANLCYELFQKNCYSEAIQVGERVLSSGANVELRVWVHSVIFACYDELGDNDSARRCIEQACLLDPNNPDLQYNLAVALSGSGCYREALVPLLRATELDPSNSLFQMTLAQQYLELGDTNRAEELLRGLLDTELHDDAHMLLVCCFLDRGDVAHGLTLALEENSARPDSATALVALARALQENGEPVKASDLLLRASELEPSNRWLAWQLGGRDA